RQPANRTRVVQRHRGNRAGQPDPRGATGPGLFNGTGVLFAPIIGSVVHTPCRASRSRPQRGARALSETTASTRDINSGHTDVYDSVRIAVGAHRVLSSESFD